MKFRVQISEHLEHRREHGLIARVLRTVVPGYNDPLHQVKRPPFHFPIPMTIFLRRSWRPFHHALHGPPPPWRTGEAFVSP